MSFFFITCSLFWSINTWNLYRPPNSKAVIGLVSFVCGLLAGELAVFLIPWQIFLACLLINSGAITGFWTTFALLAWSIAGFAQLIYLINSSLSAQPLRQALDSHTIPYLSSLEIDSQRQEFWPRVLKPFSIGLKEVHCEKNVIYGEADGETLKLDIYQAKSHRHDPSASPAPVLMYIHGGGLLEYGGTKTSQGLPLLNELARRGWVCVSIDYRLSPSHKWPAHLIDCKSALQWIKDTISDYGGNPEFVVTAGDSAGGLLSTLMAVTANDPRYQAEHPDLDSRIQGAISFYGVMDFCNSFGQSHNHELSDYWDTHVFDAGTDDASRQSKFESANAISAVQNQENPASIPDCVIIHGDRDSLVAVGESRLLADKLQQVSENKVIYSHIPGAQHAYNIFRSIRSELVLNELMRLAIFFEEKHLSEKR